jgi:PAS domain S-box-containing protein
MGREAISVLIVEDRKTDAEEMIELLRREGIDIQADRVETRDAFLDALSKPYDVILADYRLPQFSGMEALELLRERHLRIPFILVSGAVGEEIAVSAIKNGADDYLLKDRLTRLGPAVKQAIRRLDLENQNQHDAYHLKRLLRDEQERLRRERVLTQIVKLLHDDALSQSQLLENLVALLPSAWEQPDRIAVRLSIHDREYSSAEFQETRSKQTLQFLVCEDCHCSIEVAERESVFEQDTNLLAPDTESLLQNIATLIRECLERRQLQNRLRSKATILSAIHEAAIVTDTNGIVTYWNEGATRIFGWSSEEMVGKPYSARFNETVRPWIHEQFQLRLQGEDWSGEYEDVRKDGTRVWIDSHVSRMIDDEGNVIGVLGVSRDITSRKQAEEKLRESETRYRNMVESSHDLIWSVDADGVITYLNPATRWIYGRDPKEMIGKPLLEFVPADQAEKDSQVFAESVASGKDVLSYESRVYRKDGSIVTLDANARILRDEDGNFIGATGISRDVSNSIDLVESLKRSETLLANAERLGEIGSWELHVQSGQLICSENCLKIFEIDESNFDGSLDLLVAKIHPEDRDKFNRMLATADQGERVISIEHRILLACGEERIVRVLGEVTFDHLGVPIRKTAVVLDITEDIRGTLALRESEERFQLAIRGSSAGIWDWVVGSEHVFYSPRFKEMLGYGDEEFPNHFDAFCRALHPQDRDRVLAAIFDHLEKQTPYDIDYRLRTKQGQYLWFNARGAAQWSADGQPIRMAGSLVDITDQKRLEEDLIARERQQRELADELRQEKTRLAEAQSVAKVGSWETDLDSYQVIWSDETHRIFEKDPATFQPKHGDFLALVHPEDREAVRHAFDASLSKDHLHSIVHRVLLASGREKHVEEQWRVYRDENGVPLRAAGTCRDITESRQADEKIRIHTKRLEAISKISNHFLQKISLTDALSKSCKVLMDCLGPEDISFWLESGDCYRLAVTFRGGKLVSTTSAAVHSKAEDCDVTRAAKKKTLLVGGLGRQSPDSGSHIKTPSLFYPLVLHDKCFGVIEMAYAFPIEDQWMRSLEVICNVIVLNVERATVEESIRQLNAELEQRVAERTAELQESNIRLETVLSNLPGMAFRCSTDSNWTIEYASDGCRELLGSAADSLVAEKTRLIDLVYEQDQPAVREALAETLSGDAPSRAEWRLADSSKQLRWVSCSLRKVCDSDGSCVAIEGFMTDETSLKLSVMRDQRQSQIYRMLVSEASLESCLHQILTALRAEIPSITPYVMVAERNSGQVRLASGRCLPSTVRESIACLNVKTPPLKDPQTDDRDGESGYQEFAFTMYPDMSVDSKRFGFHSHFTRLLRSGPENEVVGSLNAFVDHANPPSESEQDRLDWAANLVRLAVEHHHTKSALVENEAFLRSTIDSLSQHIAVIDSSGEIVITNAAWRRFCIENGGELEKCDVGANYLTVLSKACPTETNEVEKQIRNILCGNKPEWSDEYSCESPHELLWFRQRFKQLLIDNEIHCLITHEDITETKLREKDLHLAISEANLASKAKSEFLATMSHELRTPLNGILGMNELLGSTSLSSSQKQYVDASTSSGRLLSQLIDDILDLSKIEAGRLELESRQVELPTLINEIGMAMRPVAERKRLDFRLKLTQDCYCLTVCDDNRLRQIFTNLVGNAIKFTQSGFVELTGSRITRDPGHSRFRFEIRDSGIGIPKDRLDNLFSAFSQVDSSMARRFGGTGLGLSICKELVNLMDGEIGVESEAGRGSVFWFELPLKVEAENIETSATSTDAETEKPMSRAEWKRFRGSILVAEDNKINQMYIKEILKTFGCTATIAANGEQAVQLAAAADYDLILMDCQMPEMDGFMATREIRQREEKSSTGARIPIVALTANALKGDRERCLKAGMDEYLSKPVEADRLQQVLSIYLTPADAVSPEN